MTGPLAKKELPVKDAVEGMINRKKVRGRRNQIIDCMINGMYENTKSKAEKRVEWRTLSLQ